MNQVRDYDSIKCHIKYKTPFHIKWNLPRAENRGSYDSSNYTGRKRNLQVSVQRQRFSIQNPKFLGTHAGTPALQERGSGVKNYKLRYFRQHDILEKMKEKIGLFCNVKKEHVLQNLDAPSLYEVPMMMEEEHLAQAVCECLNLPCPEPNLADWKKMLEDLRHPTSSVTIALVGKYVALHDAYLSVAEALKHGGIANRTQVNIRWIDAEELTPENLEEYLHDVDGILVPGGFGQRGTEGKILAIGYARRNKIPYLGLCLGMQLAIVEFARNVAGLSKAASIELDPETPDPVIALMPEQNGITNLGGTLRLGAYPCVLQPETLAHKLYGKTEISERHRHRYEVNNDYREVLTKNGMVLSGLSPDGRIVEMIELKEHPFFVATQAHPEFKSRPNLPHPLFKGFVKAAVAYETAGSSAV